MPRKSQSQPDVPPFEYRPGVGGFPPFGGMYRRGDESQIPPDRLHLGVNVRLANGETGSRPGMAQVAGTQESCCITGIFEIDDFAVAMRTTELSNGGINPTTGDRVVLPFQIMTFNEEKTPPDLNYWDEDSAGVKGIPEPYRRDLFGPGDCFQSFQRFNGVLLTHNGTDVFELNFDEDDEDARLDISHLFSVAEAAGADTIKSMCVRTERLDDLQTGDEFAAQVLYLGCSAGKILRYDGTTVTLEHTSTAGGDMEIISWTGIGLVAAGNTGFVYQEQPTFAWTEQLWPTGLGQGGRNFNCNGLCEWLGQIAFMGDWHDEGGSGWYGGYALRWTGSGEATIITSNVPSGGAEVFWRYRTPVVAAGSLHWLIYSEEADDPVNADTDAEIARYTDWAVGSKTWGNAGKARFFIPYRGQIVFFSRSADPVAVIWPDGDNFVLVSSGASPNYDPLYNWPLDGSGANLLDGEGYEAIPI